jgi:hypothetical protein
LPRPNDHYSTQPFLAWCLNHYFYGGVHWAYLGKPFYPYRLPNPRSSSPLRLYEDLYEPWMDRDPYSAVIQQKRINLIKGVVANEQKLAHGWSDRLITICERVDIAFFYPIVYRVDIDRIFPEQRVRIAGSGTFGSHENRIDDLKEPEFEILFLDYQEADDFNSLIEGVLSSVEALTLLEPRCHRDRFR